MTTLDALRTAPLFAQLPEADLRRLAEMAEPLSLAPGELLLREGDPGDAMYVVVSGELDVTKRSGGNEIQLARVGAGTIQGEMSAIEGRPRSASVRAITQVEVLRIPRDALLAVFAITPEAAFSVLQVVLNRLRSTESLLREREKLAGLGTLAAGLAHELNNPAAAIRRSVSSLEEAIVARDELRPPAAITELEPAEPAPALGPLDRSDRIEELEGVVGDSALAASLVDAGWTPGQLESAFDGLSADDAAGAAAWLAQTNTVRALLGEVKTAADRISEIVGAVKSYAYLDQAPVQRIDVRTGLDNTLLILQHKLRAGVDVMRDYAKDLPEIDAYGSELNQVWTNVIDNAVDAMDGRGALEVRAEPTADGGVKVTICDNGPGIPPEAQARIFEPFFTTKAPGVGTGLGLHISHTVVTRHGGDISVDSTPGRTCFVVTLPAHLPIQPSRQDQTPADRPAAH
ncbi:MAG: cyclic nucleotide-binding domain-containing protein [Chloroflexi bacterium]|nr:MAG: cyclic nucleotide-binding domain-containing protein [Chloroflexota bacterium]